MAALTPLEASLRWTAADSDPAACFIVGPPRSGTTLVFELILRRFRFAYISNLAHRLYRTPVAATWLGRRLVESWRGSFESDHGRIEGWGAPSEAGWIWDRWLPGDPYLDGARPRNLPVAEMRATVGALSRLLGGPFLSKNVLHSVQLLELDRAFPGCLVLEVHRDSRDNVRSIIRARGNEAGPTPRGGWWSVRPREWRRFSAAGPVRQAAAQVHYVHRNIEEDMTRLGPERHHVIRYSDVCRAPRAEMERLASFLAGARVHPKVRDEIPPRFDAPASRPYDDATELAIERALAELDEL